MIETRDGRWVMIVAGEASGDLHGARLVTAMQSRAEGIRFCGIGGGALRGAGMEMVADASSLSVVGITEVLGKGPSLFRAMRAAKGLLRQRRPDLLVLIDFPDFNLHLAAEAKRLGIPVLYYISPQVWAWRRGRIRTIQKRVDHMAVILPFEVDFYKQHGVPVTFVGHPLMEDLPEPCASGNLLSKTVIALLPGSREGEVNRHLPLLCRAAGMLAHRVPGIRFEVSVAPSVNRSMVEQILHRQPPGAPVHLTEGAVEQIFPRCTLAVAVSGTVTLQAALWGVPTVIIYRVSALSYWMGRALIRVPYAGLANLILGREVFPELIQSKACPETIAGAVEEMLAAPGRLEKIRQELRHVRERMGGPGASGRVAELALSMMSGQSERS